ncbi:MAPEG family protein [Nodosilinea sp. LEGE 07298]|uniref:MAPEG family protein n=1 Tax=Nodosilinea sp. LEGE 07298 TaxID=2777970 RepID=UPI00187F9768|nr:MAPEG family protein [Nodosilinea sp. LEGE 07298]MBE9108539.1 MAPEG family protein [Nodosilinea sp. LEGE 07298]
MAIPISTLFIGLSGLIAFVLSYLVVMERTRTRIWHGASSAEVSDQPSYLEQPNPWTAFVERYTQKSVATKTADDGLLQRKIRAFGNFVEYVPLALLFLVALEVVGTAHWLLWLLGMALTVGRVAHAWGVIATYGPSIGRAIGFFLTWFVYLVGAGACIYAGIAALL